nr:hypothetical protein [Pseudomonas proteolytica]
MSSESEILYIPDLAKIFGRSECSIRGGLQTGSAWLPKSFKMGNRICWLRSDVMQFIIDCRDGKIQIKPSKVGRKRQVPPTLRSIGH